MADLACLVDNDLAALLSNVDATSNGAASPEDDVGDDHYATGHLTYHFVTKEAGAWYCSASSN